MTTTPSVTGTLSQDLLDAVNTRKSSTSATGTSKSQFLQLLTQQLKNQDPMNPVDNAQMTSQLAQISTVDGISQVNDTLQTMLSTFQASAATQAAGLVGHAVLVKGTHLQLASGQSVGGVDLASAADKVSVSILDSSGAEVKRLELGAKSAGSSQFSWDGKLADGTTAADGTYTVKVSASMSGTAVDASVLQLGAVTGVVRGTKDVQIEVGKLGMFTLSDVKQILN